MKKMRRLIPAIAMLLVSAVMLSTASFAWFTMNDNVTATGMQVQAKASGNLLISKQMLTAADQDISVSFTDVTKKDLKPVTWNDTTSQWQIPSDAVTIDPLTGTMSANTWTDVSNAATLTQSIYHADYTVYLATGGDAMTSGTVKDSKYYYYDLYAKVEPIAGIDQTIAPAYTIAFLVNGVQVAEIPYEDYTNLNGHTAPTDGKILVMAGVAVPSTIGATADSKVGLRVDMRIYVDGNLSSANKDVSVANVKKIAGNGVSDDADYYAPLTAYDKTTMSTWVFYDANGAVVDSSMFDSQTNLTEKGVVTYWDTTYTTQSMPAKYVNNNSVPTSATMFSVTLSVSEVVEDAARS